MRSIQHTLRLDTALLILSFYPLPKILHHDDRPKDCRLDIVGLLSFSYMKSKTATEREHDLYIYSYIEKRNPQC